jgi:hypothetical protein
MVTSMNSRFHTRRWVAAIAAGLIVISLLSWLVLLLPSRNASSKTEHRHKMYGQSKGDSEDAGISLLHDPASSEQTASTVPTAEEAIRIHEKIEHLRDVFRENEHLSAKVIRDGPWKNAGTLTVIVIPHPTNEQAHHIYSAITQELAEFSASPNADNAMRRQVQGLLNDYILFPDNYKALVLWATPNGEVRLLQTFVADEKESGPNEANEIAGGSSSASFTNNFLKAEAQQSRYGYLFNIAPDGRSATASH